MNYLASLVWDRGTQAFESGNFSRRHRIAFDGGQTIVASSSPHVLPEPLSDASGIDPEELLVAALSSCHMLWFLVIAARKKFRVDRYLDSAAGSMADIGDGRIAMAEVVLRPAVTFSGSHLLRQPPSPAAACRQPKSSWRCTTRRTSGVSSRDLASSI